MPFPMFILVYKVLTFLTVGLILWGISVDYGYHWMVGQVALFLCKCLKLTQANRSRRVN